MDIFDLADTALKIGLGAAVSGVATFKVAKLNHDREVDKQALVRRLDSLEKASLSFQQYAHAWRLWCGRLVGLLKGENPPTESLSKAQLSKFTDVDQDYQKAREHLIVAVAGLHLLGAHEAISALNAVVGAIAAFRDDVVFRKKVPTMEQYDDFMRRVSDLKKTFEMTLSTLYMKKS